MGSFTFSEILTIVIVILIIFGPNRLPELARKAGQWATKARYAVQSLRDEFVTEYRDAVEPIVQARDELRATRDELRSDVKEIEDDLKLAASETKEAVERAGELPSDRDEEASDPVPADDESPGDPP